MKRVDSATRSRRRPRRPEPATFGTFVAILFLNHTAQPSQSAAMTSVRTAGRRRPRSSPRSQRLPAAGDGPLTAGQASVTPNASRCPTMLPDTRSRGCRPDELVADEPTSRTRGTRGTCWSLGTRKSRRTGHRVRRALRSHRTRRTCGPTGPAAPTAPAGPPDRQRPPHRPDPPDRGTRRARGTLRVPRCPADRQDPAAPQVPARHARPILLPPPTSPWRRRTAPRSRSRLPRATVNRYDPSSTRLRKAHDHFRVARPQDLHPLGLAEHGRRLLAEIQTAQRHGLVLDIDKRRQHHELLPAIEIVEAAVRRLRVQLPDPGPPHACAPPAAHMTIAADAANL